MRHNHFLGITITMTTAILTSLAAAGSGVVSAKSPVGAKLIQWEGAQSFSPAFSPVMPRNGYAQCPQGVPRVQGTYGWPAVYQPASVCYTWGEKVELFNHTDLTGWTDSNGEEPKGWNVVDGLLCHDATGDNLFTEKEYESFILEFEFQVETGKETNSGVKYKTWFGDNWWMGCEYQILDDNGNGDSGDLHLTASLYDVYPPAIKSGLLKYDDFNQGKIVVMGNYVEHWLNGTRTVAAVIDSPDWLARVAKSKFKDEQNFGHIKSSRIFLQHHSTPVRFRNISITELKEMTY